MKEYDLIIIGTGSAMNYVDSIISMNPDIRIAVIDKDEPGGICLTRGCIPSKLLIYPAEVIRTIESSKKFGIDANIKRIDFPRIMGRMRKIISDDIQLIREGFSDNSNIDYYQKTAEFIAPYAIKVGAEKIKSKKFFLCTGSKPIIPKIKGLENAGYITSDTILNLKKLPESIAIIGGGYIAAEYGHFFSAMGSKVTIVGRNPRILPKEEPEVSSLAKKVFSDYMTVLVGHEAIEVQKAGKNKKIIAKDTIRGKETEIFAEEILVAAGRGPNTDILHPEKAKIKTDSKGWIVVDKYLETSKPDIWAFGDANGKHLFKHVGNYESGVVYYNAVLERKVEADYHAVPHAVFSYPEIAGVGMSEKEAIEKHKDRVLIGIERYQDTAKGHAMDVQDYFVKVIVEKGTYKILGAHIIGPHASILIQEVINLMYTMEGTADPIIKSMHIHPALSEVVERAFGALVSPEHYHHILRDFKLE